MTGLRFGDLTFQEHEVELNWQRLAARRAVPESIRVSGRVNVMEAAYGEMLIELTSYVLGQKLPPHEVAETRVVRFERPASWWQHFKQQYAARWWARRLVARRPARMVEETERVTLTATWRHMAAYPWTDYVVPVRKFGEPVLLRWVEQQVTTGDGE